MFRQSLCNRCVTGLKLPNSYTIGGGRILIFKYPNGYNLNCDATGKLAVHVDIRANGGLCNLG